MKKSKLILLCVMTVLFSCKNKVGEDMPNVESSGINYFKDKSTNLCFAKIYSYSYGAYEVASITCVPCDSLKRIGLN